MGLSKEWDERYKEGSQLSVWPWTDVISLIMRYARPDKRPFRVLELGCGAGANIPFMRRLRGVDYYSVEGSPFMVKQLRRRFPFLKKNIIQGDFTRKIPFRGPFDLIFDRASLSHNTTAAIARCLSLVYDRLAVGGKYIGVDWFSSQNTDFRKKRGRSAGDRNTRCGFVTPPFARVGNVHFSDEKHLRRLFCGFEIEVLEHKTVCQKIPNNSYVHATWNFVARKGMTP